MEERKIPTINFLKIWVLNKIFLNNFDLNYRITRAIVPRVSCKNRGFDPVPPDTKQNLKIPFFANISRSTGPIWAIFFFILKSSMRAIKQKKDGSNLITGSRDKCKIPSGYYTILWNFSRGVLYIGGYYGPRYTVFFINSRNWPKLFLKSLV